MGKETPTVLTLRALRERGFTCAIVEHWNSFANIRQDMYGFIDVIAIKPELIIGVQCCDHSNLAAHRKKIKVNKNAPIWLEAGREIEIWSWGDLVNKKNDLKIEYITEEVLAVKA